MFPFLLKANDRDGCVRLKRSFAVLEKASSRPSEKAAILGTDPVRELELFLVFQAQ
jgi:hypothetical protein